MSMTKDIGIDLGTASVLVYVKGKGIVLNEPSVVAMDKTTGKLLKVGAEAQAMLGRTPGNIIAIRPLREGVISDYDMTERMLREFIHKVAGVSFFKPRVIICVPSGITEVEERAVIDAGIQAGARRVYLIEEPVAAAIGAGIDIAKPDGHMIVDIGGGTTDVAVLSLKGISTSSSLRVGGDDMDAAIVRYLRTKYNLIIGTRMAESIKKSIGSAMPPETASVMEAKGRGALTGLPAVRPVDALEIGEALSEPLMEMLSGVQRVLETTPPELAGDVMEHGMVLTGGGAKLVGLAQFIQTNTGVSCRVAEQPDECVAVGTGKALKFAKLLSAGVYDVDQFSYHLSETLTN